MLNIRIERTANPRKKPEPGTPLGFGKIFTDHMFVMNYTRRSPWSPVPWCFIMARPCLRA